MSEGVPTALLLVSWITSRGLDRCERGLYSIDFRIVYPSLATSALFHLINHETVKVVIPIYQGNLEVSEHVLPRVTTASAYDCGWCEVQVRGILSGYSMIHDTRRISCLESHLEERFRKLEIVIWRRAVVWGRFVRIIYGDNAVAAGGRSRNFPATLLRWITRFVLTGGSGDLNNF